MKKIFAGLMSLAMVLGLAFAGGSQADASTGSGTGRVTTTFGGIEPELSVGLVTDSYTWGTSKYVQQSIIVDGGEYCEYDVITQPERNISGVWTPVAGAEQTFRVVTGQTLIANSLIASNGIYKAKGNYRIQYTFVKYANDRSVFDGGNSKTFNIN